MCVGVFGVWGCVCTLRIVMLDKILRHISTLIIIIILLRAIPFFLLMLLHSKLIMIWTVIFVTLRQFCQSLVISHLVLHYNTNQNGQLSVWLLMKASK